MSCVRNSCDIFGEGVEDFLGGFAPDEGFGVGVPVLDPGFDVFLQCGNAFVDTAAQELIGEEPEPAFGG